MKIYTKLILNMDDGQVITEESFHYIGEVSYCGGGKSSQQVQTVSTPEPVQKAQTKNITQAATAAREAQKENAASAKGIKSTILTNQQANESSTTKTLLGQ